MSIRYVLYTHFAFREGKDFQEWQSGTPCDQLPGVQYLLRHLPRLQELLTSPGHEGVLVLFYARGLSECLDGIAGRLDKDRLLAKCPALQFSMAVARYVGTHVDASLPRLSARLRFLTPLDLVDIFGRMNWNLAKDLKRFIAGGLSGSHYDSPKIVEAIVRLRLLGTNVPVFRLDWDVLFRGSENQDLPDLGLFKALDCSLAANAHRRDASGVATYLFSASYDTHGVGVPDEAAGPERFFRWSRAFATRIFPALPIEPKGIQSALDQVTSWEQYAANVFDVELARRFYGFAETDLRSQELSGISCLGAHPLVSVISGALFCISEGAILDLPPFSNFRLNVSWIDDHLKYSLHRELRHLATTTPENEPLLSHAKLDDVMVQKARGPIDNLPVYVLGDYMPTLLWGCIVDAWITPDPLLKYRPHELSAKTRTQWEKIQRQGSSAGPLSGALQAALEKGEITYQEKEALKIRLTAVALARIKEARKRWSELGSKHECFASLWAKGKVHKVFPTIEGRGLGLAPAKSPLKSIDELNGPVLQDFNCLLQDAVDYIEWTLHWPKFVQVVRSVEQGTLRTDISWKP